MGRPLAWRLGKGRRREALAVPWFILKYLSFDCGQLGSLDGTGLGTESCEDRWRTTALSEGGSTWDCVQDAAREHQAVSAGHQAAALS